MYSPQTMLRGCFSCTTSKQKEKEAFRMDTAKPTIRPMVVRVALFNLLACLAVDGAAFWALRLVSRRVAAAAGAAQPGAEVVALSQWMQSAAQSFWPYRARLGAVLCPDHPVHGAVAAPFHSPGRARSEKGGA